MCRLLLHGLGASSLGGVCPSHHIECHPRGPPSAQCCLRAALWGRVNPTTPKCGRHRQNAPRETCSWPRFATGSTAHAVRAVTPALRLLASARSAPIQQHAQSPGADIRSRISIEIRLTYLRTIIPIYSIRLTRLAGADSAARGESGEGWWGRPPV